MKSLPYNLQLVTLRQVVMPMLWQIEPIQQERYNMHHRSIAIRNVIHSNIHLHHTGDNTMPGELR